MRIECKRIPNLVFVQGVKFMLAIPIKLRSVEHTSPIIPINFLPHLFMVQFLLTEVESHSLNIPEHESHLDPCLNLKD